MTVGEKIQEYRKQFGFSQEELGQKLNLSRQTVSLWENGQTSPTIDNLLRLKEIFGVSVDNLLGCETPMQKNKEALPIESYIFNFSEKEINYLYKTERNLYLKKPIIVSLILILLSFTKFYVNSGSATFEKESFYMAPFFLGILLIYMTIKIKELLSLRKKWQNVSLKISESKQEYCFYPDYFAVTTKKDKEIIQTQKISFNNIKKIEKSGNFIKLLIDENMFLLKENEIPQNSPFLYFLNTSPLMKVTPKLFDKYSILSVASVIASVTSLFAAIAISFTISLNEAPMAFASNMWVLYLFTPVPIASIILGIFLRKKGYAFKKNIVVGILMVFLLCIYGSFSFIFGNMVTDNNELLLKTEELTGIDLPEYKSISTSDWTQGTQNTPRGYIYTVCDISILEANTLIFNKTVAKDDKWLKTIPNDLIGITSAFCDNVQNAYILTYNIDTEEYNTLPEQNGKYRFINIIFMPKVHTIRIVEYEMQYVK